MTSAPSGSPGHPHAIWRDHLDAAERAALEPGRHPVRDWTPDVLVVGGGLVGLATALACAEAGLGHVVLVERDRLGAGASGGAAALLSPALHEWTDPPEFVDLGRAGLAGWRILDEQSRGALGVRRLDFLVPLVEAPIGGAPSPRPGMELLDADGVRAVEPELAPAGAGVLFTDQGHVHPLHAAAVIARRLAEAGGDVVTGVAMTGVDEVGDTIRAVDTTAGTYEPGVVVFATGLAPERVGVPQRWVKGHLVATAPAPFRLRVAIAAPAGLVVQLAGGALVSGGTLDDADHTPDPDPVVTDGIARELATLVPAAGPLAVTHRWCCFRPMVTDGQPVVDRVPGTTNAWVTCGHYRTGILMAPATGDVLARWIESGRRPPEVDAFGIARFSDRRSR